MKKTDFFNKSSSMSSINLHNYFISLISFISASERNINAFY